MRVLIGLAAGAGLLVLGELAFSKLRGILGHVSWLPGSRSSHSRSRRHAALRPGPGRVGSRRRVRGGDRRGCHRRPPRLPDRGRSAWAGSPRCRSWAPVRRSSPSCSWPPPSSARPCLPDVDLAAWLAFVPAGPQLARTGRRCPRRRALVAVAGFCL
jgi:hypothetical protein